MSGAFKVTFHKPLKLNYYVLNVCKVPSLVPTAVDNWYLIINLALYKLGYACPRVEWLAFPEDVVETGVQAILVLSSHAFRKLLRCGIDGEYVLDGARGDIEEAAFRKEVEKIDYPPTVIVNIGSWVEFPGRDRA